VSETTARALIEARVNTNKPTGFDVLWANTATEVPDPDTDNVDGYMVVTYATATESAFQADVGAGTNLYRHPGLLILSLFTLRHLGAGAGTSRAVTVAAAFRGKQEESGAASVQYRTPTIRSIGPVGNWFQTDVEVPYEYDEQFTVV